MCKYIFCIFYTAYIILTDLHLQHKELTVEIDPRPQIFQHWYIGFVRARAQQEKIGSDGDGRAG